jgi:4-diphosphocytidyl-2-C-methyl-D-erythritol kinase
MLTFAPAKINLGLLVTEKREDGYHNIETVFYAIKLYDVIEITEADSFGFRSNGLALPRDGQNLCEKAYRLLAQDYAIKPVQVELLKNIPIGAGLGGGSSDAAQVLKLLNEMNQLGLSGDALREYAKRLGADCPFFVDHQPVFASAGFIRLLYCGCQTGYPYFDGRGLSSHHATNARRRSTSSDTVTDSRMEVPYCE